MEQQLQHLHEDIFSAYTRLSTSVKWAQSQVRKHATSPKYCADVAFAMAELDKMIKDMGVQVRKTRELAEAAAIVVWMHSDDDGPIRTDHCTASPRLKLQPAMPKKDSPELAELFEWMGMPEESRSLVRVHWPSLCDAVTACIENGKPIPKCIKPEDMHNPSGVLQFYKKKEVTE